MFKIEFVDSTRWLEIAGRSPDATFFHTPIWASIATGQLNEGCLGLRLPGGTLGILPGIVRRVGPYYLVESSPFGTYGGLVSEEPLDRVARVAAYERVGADRRMTACSVVERCELAPEELREWSVVADQTHILKLDGVSEQALLEGMHGRRRRDIRKAVERGVEVRIARSGSDWRNYFDVYEDSLRRWGADATSQYASALFERMEMVAVDHPSQVQLWLATVGDDVAAGGIVLTWNGQAIYWHGASMTSLRSYSASSLLVWRMICHARESGCDTFDFSPSGGHDGVATFKAHFGAQAVGISRLSLDSRLGDAISTGTRVARRIVRRARQMTGRE